jgi:LysM repeat protein
MNDNTQVPPNNEEPRQTPAEGQPRSPAEGMPLASDEAALERLQALSEGGQASPSDEPMAAPAAGGGLMGSLRRSSLRGRPSMGGLTPARVAAPVIFLAAVIVVVVLLFQSGLMGGQSETAVSPTPNPSARSSGSAATKAYVVKKGDTLSGIATKFDTSVSKLEDLNPDMSGSTLGVGDKIKVPNK